ncbi:MAG: methyltransferase, partial [Bradyrhizobium sp.]
MIELMGEVTEDAFLGGTLRLRQPKSGHRAGHDAMLLAAATPARSGDRVVDFGSGVGAAGLAVAKRVAGIKPVLVEIDEG